MHATVPNVTACIADSVRWVANGDERYEAGAIVPDGEWIKIDFLDLPLTGAGTLDSETIEFVRAPAGLNEAREYIRDSFPTGGSAQIKGWWSSDDTVQSVRQLDRRELSPLSDGDFLTISIEAPGQLTTSRRSPGSKRIGLHLDNWDQMPMRTRSESRRRLAVNLGPGSRALLFASPTACQICRSLGRTDDHLPHTTDVREFVANGGPLRCYSVVLEPGQAYVAPTELLVHDGSTLDARLPSIVAFWLGRWPVGFLEPA
ncbi:hypothetical protein [Smaragdicoccus niigatensis]|uniref:hypothetical protein n=1 Tax=Smaragdicoccus niigatensis TaxID=359359 RepID=UPI00035CFBBE|nr:hypothetical protein [Smaragdicoccus niigatensis]